MAIFYGCSSIVSRIQSHYMDIRQFSSFHQKYSVGNCFMYSKRNQVSLIITVFIMFQTQVTISHRQPKKIFCLKQFAFSWTHFDPVCITKANACVKFGFQSVKLSYSIIMEKKVKIENNFIKLSRFWLLRGKGI